MFAFAIATRKATSPLVRESSPRSSGEMCLGSTDYQGHARSPDGEDESAQAMEQAGIRPSQRIRRVSDYVLNQLIARRSRLSRLARDAFAPDRRPPTRSALPCSHRGDARRAPDDSSGPPVANPNCSKRCSIRDSPRRRVHRTRTRAGTDLRARPARDSPRPLPHSAETTAPETERLDLLRQIAEVDAVRPRETKVVHRALSPAEHSGQHGQPAVSRPDQGLQLAGRLPRRRAPHSGVSRMITATSHVDRLVDDASTAYMAPEAISDDDNIGEHLDVFSLGAIAYHLFSGQPPATNGLELSNKLRETKGLQISSVLNGAGEMLQDSIQYSTHPDVSGYGWIRCATFWNCWRRSKTKQTSPEHENYVDDPDRAKKDDLLPGGSGGPSTRPGWLLRRAAGRERGTRNSFSKSPAIPTTTPDARRGRVLTELRHHAHRRVSANAGNRRPVRLS